jgi:hypothetical protein
LLIAWHFVVLWWDRVCRISKMAYVAARCGTPAFDQQKVGRAQFLAALWNHIFADNELRIDVARSRHIILAERSASAAPFGDCTGACQLRFTQMRYGGPPQRYRNDAIVVGSVRCSSIAKGRLRCQTYLA